MKGREGSGNNDTMKNRYLLTQAADILMQVYLGSAARGESYYLVDKEDM